MMLKQRLYLILAGLTALLVFSVLSQFVGLAFYYQIRGSLAFSNSGIPDQTGILPGYCFSEQSLSSAAEQDLRQALDFLDRSIKSNPRIAHSYLLLGRTLCSLGSHDQALKAFQHYQMLRPDNPVGYIEEAFARLHMCRSIEHSNSENSTLLSLNEECEETELSEIEKLWTKARVQASDFRYAGDQALGLGEYQIAMNYYEWSIRVDPEAPDNWARFGAVCQQISEMDSSICQDFIDYNLGNWFVDPDLTFPNLSILWKRYETGPGIYYQFSECPDLPGKTCANMVLGRTNRAVSGIGLYQCLSLKPGATYRFSAWIRANVMEEGQYRMLYVGGTINGEAAGFWATKERSIGPLEWSYEEYSFTAPKFDGQACVHPIRLESQGEAWFHSPSLVMLVEP